MILHGNNKLIEVLPLGELYTDYLSHKRLSVFANKGRECVICGREGVLLLKTQGKHGDIHIDLFTEDFVMITVDHITPKAVARELGWNSVDIEALRNKQPMCGPCNWGKSDSTASNEEIRQRMTGKPSRRSGPELIRLFVDNPNIFNRKIPETIAFSL